MNNINWDRYIEQHYSIKDKVVLCDTGNFVIVFDLNIMAPISKAFDYAGHEQEEWCQYMAEELFWDKIPVFYINSAAFNRCINLNTAGLNQECLSWEQIIELYK